jgi:hypothetical protein
MRRDTTREEMRMQLCHKLNDVQTKVVARQQRYYPSARYCPVEERLGGGGGGRGTYGYSQGATMQVHLTAAVKQTRFGGSRMTPRCVEIRELG